MLRQLTSSELAELYAYDELYPAHPATERLFAQLTSIVAQCAGNKVSEADFYIRKPAADAGHDGESNFIEMLRATSAKG